MQVNINLFNKINLRATRDLQDLRGPEVNKDPPDVTACQDFPDKWAGLEKKEKKVNCL
jgi:hypothetical protein